MIEGDVDGADAPGARRTSARCWRRRARLRRRRQDHDLSRRAWTTSRRSTRSTASGSRTIRRRARPCRRRGCRATRAVEIDAIAVDADARREATPCRRRSIESVLTETRSFPPPAGVRRGGARQEPRRVRGAVSPRRRRSRGVLGRASPASSTWAHAVGPRARLEAARREVVRRRQAQRQRQLPRPPPRRAGARTRPRSSGRASRATRACSRTASCTARSARPRTRSTALGVRAGRPRRDLHADDPRGRDRDARVRAASARRTRSCSAASRPRRCATASTTRRRKVVITADGGWRRGAIVPLKANVDDALDGTPTVENVVVVQALRERRSRWKPARDLWWHEVVDDGVADATTPTRSTASTRSSPLHERHDRQAEGHPAHDRRLPDRRDVHDEAGLRPASDDDIFWCTADIGWVTGHSYVVYGPLANGATVLMYEGAPNQPGPDRFWEHHREVRRHDLLHGADRDPRVHELGRRVARRSTTCRRCACSARSASRSTPRRGCGTASVIGGERCPIVDTWWQTETGGIMISPLPGATPTKPGSATRPLPGHRRRRRRQGRHAVRAERGRLPRDQAAVAVDAAHDLRRPRALREDVLRRDRRAATSPATARAATRTATSG